VQSESQSANIDTQNSTVLTLIFFILVITAAGLLGALTHVIAKWVYIPVLFPVLLGLLAVNILRRLSKTLRVTNPAVIGIAGIVFSIAAYGTYHYIEYLELRAELLELVIRESANSNRILTADQAEQLMDRLLYNRFGVTGFLGVLSLRAEAGVWLRLLSSRMNGMPLEFSLKGIFVWVYWLAEFVIIGWMTRDYAKLRSISYRPKPIPYTFGGSNPSNRLICDKCGSKYVQESIGAVPMVLESQLRTAIQNRKFRDLGQLVLSNDLGSLVGSEIDLTLEHCDNCNESKSLLHVTVEEIYQPQKLIYKIYITPEQHASLLDAMPQSVAEYKQKHVNEDIDEEIDEDEDTEEDAADEG
jgi:hypothetical protein